MDIPFYKIPDQSGHRIFLHRMTPLSSQQRVRGLHRDDYYVFGWVEAGSVCLRVDFSDYRIAAGEAFAICPGQVHRFVESDHPDAYGIVVDRAYVDLQDREVFSRCFLGGSPVKLDKEQRQELGLLFSLLGNRVGRDDASSWGIVRHLAAAFVGVMMQAIRASAGVHPMGGKRNIEIVSAFHALLVDEIRTQKRPSYYAGRLNISPVYLNEAVKAVTGLSASRYIRREAVLQAERMLLYSPKTIREIAFELGFEDSAYFSKVFVRTTGITPARYRKENLE